MSVKISSNDIIVKLRQEIDALKYENIVLQCQVDALIEQEKKKEEGTL